MYCLGGCGRLLRDPKSRKRRYGPECAEKLGLMDPPAPRFARRDGGDCEGRGDLLGEDHMAIVYVTARGDRYHRAPNCEYLTSGQDGGAVLNYTLHPWEPVNLSEVPAGKTPCKCLGVTPEGTTP
ncbi:DUF6011 domain-containing protein [Nonomuraea sp. NPDC050786]|uniref:DUF6011 domain-containing protein n=1 Tax=Nonomuraea sp. NPDC050786 TaxID=3154840 RepID=UPI0033CE2D56